MQNSARAPPRTGIASAPFLLGPLLPSACAVIGPISARAAICRPISLQRFYFNCIFYDALLAFYVINALKLML